MHLGNLSSSLLAALQVYAAEGRLIYRVEDLDPPRCVPGAELQQQEDLRWLGIEWDEGAGAPSAAPSAVPSAVPTAPQPAAPSARTLSARAAPPYRQSERGHLYLRALEQLRDLTFPCFCSRRDVRDALSAPHAAFDPALEYPGTCRGLEGGWERAAREEHAIRCVFDRVVEHVDGVWGAQRTDLSSRPGAFVVQRKDGLFAYQLAVVVDDIAMGVTDVLRGVDLLDSTPRQLALFDALGAPRPRTWHVPLLVDERGERLSKRAQSVARDGLEASGWCPSTLRGAFATLWGWTDRLAALSFADLERHFDLSSLRCGEIRVPDAFFRGPRAFEAWLISHGTHGLRRSPSAPPETT